MDMVITCDNDWLFFSPDREEERQNNTEAVLNALEFYDDHVNKQKEDDHGIKYMESYVDDEETPVEDDEGEPTPVTTTGRGK